MAYHSGRDTTLRYLASGAPRHPNIHLYFDALAQWEAVLLHWSVCLRIVKAMSQKNLFEKNDGSSEERAYRLQNEVKHWAETPKHEREATVPVWLTNAGINSTSVALEFAELADLIRDTSRLCNEIQDPVGFKASVIEDRVRLRAYVLWETRTGQRWWDSESNWLEAQELELRELEQQSAKT